METVRNEDTVVAAATGQQEEASNPAGKGGLQRILQSLLLASQGKGSSKPLYAPELLSGEMQMGLQL